jgi:hypothetical protein
MDMLSVMAIVVPKQQARAALARGLSITVFIRPETVTMHKPPHLARGSLVTPLADMNSAAAKDVSFLLERKMQ